MKTNETGCCKIVSLRELRRMRSANETARMAACGRVAGEVSNMFSLSNLLPIFVTGYLPSEYRHYIESLFSFFK